MAAPIAAAGSAGGSTGGFFGSAAGQAAIQGGISIGGNLFSAREAKKANRRNVALYHENRDWEEMMSNTSWQRGVKDMMAAGINPMLAVSQGGASTPTSAAVTVDQEKGWSGAMASAAKAADLLTLKQQQANINLTNAQAYKATQEGTSAAGQAKWAEDSARLENMIKGEQWANLKRQYDLTDWQAKQIEQMLPALLATERARAQLADAQTASAKTQTESERLRQPELEATAKWFESQIGSNSKAAGFFKDVLQLWNQIRGK